MLLQGQLERLENESDLASLSLKEERKSKQVSKELDTSRRLIAEYEKRISEYEARISQLESRIAIMQEASKSGGSESLLQEKLSTSQDAFEVMKRRVKGQDQRLNAMKEASIQNLAETEELLAKFHKRHAGFYFIFIFIFYFYLFLGFLFG